ncbi:MAG TPA: hypothetical protein VHJ20_21725 [Polyangia bacterium]|nr:hypothetical protein [Polyangia bacterium]
MDGNTDLATPYLLTVRGTLVPKSIDEARTLHNATAGSAEGMAAARALSDVSHTVYVPARGAEMLSGAKPGELLFLDHWLDPAGLQQFFAHKDVQAQAGKLFSSRDGSLWMSARGSFGFHAYPTAGKPPRFVGLLRAPVTSPEKAIAAFAGLVSKNLRTARTRGQLSHELFVRMGAPGEPVEILGVDTWATIEGLSTHYADPAAMSGLDGAFAGAPTASVWEQATGFNEW